MVKDYDSLVPVRYEDLPFREPIRRTVEDKKVPPKEPKNEKRVWSRESLRTLFCR